MRFVGSDVLITEEGQIRIALEVEASPGGAWATLFEDAPPPVTSDELLDAYLLHGVDGSELYVELKPGVSEEAVLYALDWLKASANQASLRHLQLEAQAAQARETVRQWLEQDAGDH